MIVGSKAIQKCYPNFREPKDLDIWIYKQGDLSGFSIKSKIKTEIWSAEDYPVLGYILNKYKNPEFCPLGLLLTIKLSHSFWNLSSFDKTLWDINFLKEKGYDKAIDWESFDSLYSLWLGIHGAKKGKLNKKNGEFFKDNVKRKYSHDAIHDIIKYYDDCPMYLKIKKDPSSALTSWDLFDALPLSEKLKVCREEISVLALERFLIPSEFSMPTNLAWRNATKNMICGIWRGKWATFLSLNYGDLRVPDKDHDFVKMFDNAVKENKIKPLEKV